MSKEVKKFKDYKPLSNDISNDIKPSEGGEEDFEPKDWEIESIVDIQTEDPEKSEEELLSNIEEAITFDMSVPKDIKRGDYLWITALIKNKNGGYNDPGRQAVIKVRVTELYYGLAHLNKVINQ